MASAGKSEFSLGLGVTQIIDAFAKEFGGTASTLIAIVLDVGAAGIFVLFGIFANQKHLWSFITGMVLYTLDGLMYLLVQDWLAAGFHGFALFCIFVGLRATWQYKQAAR